MKLKMENSKFILLIIKQCRWSGFQVLCLAGAGGQQAPYLAAAGADVTVFDLSENMLKKDEFVAKRDGLKLTIIQGNMCVKRQIIAN